MRMPLFMVMLILAAGMTLTTQARLGAQIKHATAPRGEFDRSGMPRREEITEYPVADASHLASKSAPPSLSAGSQTAEKPNHDRRMITPPASARGMGKSSTVPNAWTTFGALAVVIALILVTAKVWKKHGPLSAGLIPHEAVELLGRRMIDQRQAIHLVRLGTRILVLGSSAAGLRTLAEISDPVEVDFLAGLCQKRDGERGTLPSFRALLKKQSVAPSTTAAPTATITTTAPRPRAERELEQRIRATGDMLRENHLERTHG